MLRSKVEPPALQSRTTTLNFQRGHTIRKMAVSKYDLSYLDIYLGNTFNQKLLR